MGSAILEDSTGRRGVGEGSHFLTGFDDVAAVVVATVDVIVLELDAVAAAPFFAAPFACTSSPLPLLSALSTAAPLVLFLVVLPRGCGCGGGGSSCGGLPSLAFDCLVLRCPVLDVDFDTGGFATRLSSSGSSFSGIVAAGNVRITAFVARLLLPAAGAAGVSSVLSRFDFRTN